MGGFQELFLEDTSKPMAEGTGKDYAHPRGETREEEKMKKNFKINLEVCSSAYLKKNQKFFRLLERSNHLLILQDYKETNWFSLLKVESKQDSEVIPVPVFLDMVGENTTGCDDDYHQILVDFLNRHEISLWIKDKDDPENWDGQTITDRDGFLAKTLNEDRTEWFQERIVSEELLEDDDFRSLCAVSERVPQELKAANVKEQKQLVNEFLEALLQHEATYLQHKTMADGKVETLLHIKNDTFTDLMECFSDQIIKKGVIGPYEIIPWGKFEEVSHCQFESASEDHGAKIEINEEFTPVLTDQDGNRFFVANSYTWDWSEHLKGFGYNKTMIQVGGKRLLAVPTRDACFVIVVGSTPFVPIQGNPDEEKSVWFEVDEDLRRNRYRAESKLFKSNKKNVAKDQVFVQDDLFRRMLTKFPGLLENTYLAYRWFERYQEVNISGEQISSFREKITKLVVGNMHWRPRIGKYTSEVEISDEISMSGENDPDKDIKVVVKVVFGGFLKEVVHFDWYGGKCWWDYDSSMRDSHEKWQIARYRNSLRQAALAFVSFGIEIPETTVPDIMWKDSPLHRETVDLLDRDRTFYPYHGIAASMRGAYMGWHRVLDKFGKDEVMRVFRNFDLFNRDPDLLVIGLFGTAERHVHEFGGDPRIAKPFFQRLELPADEKAEIISLIDGHEKIRRQTVSGLAECLDVDYSFDGDSQWCGSVDKIIRI